MTKAPKPMALGDSITLVQTCTVSDRTAAKGKSFVIVAKLGDPAKEVVMGEAQVLLTRGKAKRAGS